MGVRPCRRVLGARQLPNESGHHDLAVPSCRNSRRSEPAHHLRRDGGRRDARARTPMCGHLGCLEPPQGEIMRSRLPSLRSRRMKTAGLALLIGLATVLSPGTAAADTVTPAV